MCLQLPSIADAYIRKSPTLVAQYIKGSCRTGSLRGGGFAGSELSASVAGATTIEGTLVGGHVRLAFRRVCALRRSLGPRTARLTGPLRWTADSPAGHNGTSSSLANKPLDMPGPMQHPHCVGALPRRFSSTSAVPLAATRMRKARLTSGHRGTAALRLPL